MESELEQFEAEEYGKKSVQLLEVSNSRALAERLDYTFVGYSHGVAFHLEIPSVS